MNLVELRNVLKNERYEWRRHTLERLAERGLTQADVLSVLLTGELIEENPKDTPFPSALFFANTGGRPLHVVAAFDEGNQWAYIITAYMPDLQHFEADFKRRRMRE